ncbi:AMP-binding protein [Butyrivibrio sp. M55]|uniref:AMP-binding protein n=1 Tax=Butyrivibrio sp. M55 TaxID=1855323 RepID=UPI0008E5CE4F|nr:AMP-binding protein [Butyrivibrio sp. M55]SFU54172.1 long-chain acyl-CoA synthetase [Butyrivibrio sp. M55]
MDLSRLLDYMDQNACNSVAVFCKEKKTIKFQDMKLDVLKMVSYIKKIRKLPKGEYIGIVGDNSYEWMVVDLACLVGGWISVSFHAKDFEANKNALLTKYNMQVVFADAPYCEDDKRYVPFEKVFAEIANIDTYDKKVKFEFAPKDVFTIIYTSGTTGTPKALKIMAGAVESFINGFYSLYDFTSEDKVFIFLPLSVLTCRAYIYASIMGGIDILLADMSTFTMAMKVGKPTILQGVPHLFETVYDTVNGVITSDIKKKVAVNTFFALKHKHLIPKKYIEIFQKKFLKAFHDFWGGKMRLMITGSASIRRDVLEFYNDAGIPLYEAYGINEGGVLAINYPGNVRIGSVGKPFMQRNIKIAEDGEVLVKNDDYAFACGYQEDDLAFEKKVYRSDGYIATGDIGYFDKDGFLYLCGRKKEIITLSNGEKIMPAQMENRIKESDMIKQICLFGNEKPFLVAIVTPSNKDIIREDVDNEVKRFKKYGEEYAKIKDVILTREPFSIDNKELNVNLKLARKEIATHYKNELKQIFGMEI